jgi:hypothetical protein
VAGKRPPAGLCDTCRHQRLVDTTRGSQFSLCELSREDDDYPRYPRVPVRACPGYEGRTEPASSDSPSSTETTGS